MADSYTDNSGNRILVRNRGPVGPGVPPGGTDGQILAKVGVDDYTLEWINSPTDPGVLVHTGVAPLDAEIVVYDGITGTFVKSSGKTLSYYAAASSVANKVDKVTGWGLSTNDYSTADKDKLAAIDFTSGYRGTFATYELVTEEDFSPAPEAGDYCLIEVEGEELQVVYWDDTNSEWYLYATPVVVLDGAEIATALFHEDDAATYDIEDCRILTSDEKALIASHEALLQALGPVLPGATASYGEITYFNLTGTAVAIAAISDGSTNTVLCNVPSATFGVSSAFDDGGASSGRLRYTGTSPKTFRVNANLTLSDCASTILVVSIAKNGIVEAGSRILVAMDAGGTETAVSLSALISLTTNDYVEVFIGNTTSVADPTVNALSMNAMSS